MGLVIGEILPFALGIAISPIPIIAAILMLLSPRARRTSLGFLAGWVLGILIAAVVFTLLAAVLPESSTSGSQPIVGVVKLVLGAALVVLAVRQWRSRPHGDAEPALPAWMAAIDAMTAGRALVLGFALAAVNPKNLLMAAAGGVSIGSAELSTGAIAVVVGVFTVLAAATVLVPVVAYLVASAAMARPLESLRAWLVHNNATVMATLLLVIGVITIGKGIGSF